MKKIVFLISFFLVCNLSFAQISNLSTNISGEPIRLKSYKDISGSPYLSEEWQMGTVFSLDANNNETVMLRYNIYEDKVEYKKDGMIYGLVSESVKGFSVAVPDPDGKVKRYVFENKMGKVGEYTDRNFFSILYADKVKFLQKIVVKLIDNTATYGTNVQQSKFVKEEEFYLVKETGESFKVKKNNGSLLKILNNKELKDFVKNNNLNIKEDKDLIEALKFYESKLVK
jgi:hypothetical protein